MTPQIRKLAFKVVHSTTILGPAWMALCRVHNLNERYIPRDVRTRWNSTYDMLSVALKYRAVYNEFTANSDPAISVFNLTLKEWQIGEQLEKILKVRTLFCGG